MSDPDVRDATSADGPVRVWSYEWVVAVGSRARGGDGKAEADREAARIAAELALGADEVSVVPVIPDVDASATPYWVRVWRPTLAAEFKWHADAVAYVESLVSVGADPDRFPIAARGSAADKELYGASRAC